MKSVCMKLALALLCIVFLCGCGILPADDRADVSSAAPIEDGVEEETTENEENLGYTVIPATKDEESEPPPVELDPKDEVLETLLSDMSLEERVAQMLFVSCPSSGGAEILSEYALGGYIFFASHFSGLTAEEVRGMVEDLQRNAKIPLLIGVDEEGGTVVRVSSNPNLREKPFASPRELLAEGGDALLIADAQEKSQLLLSLGINVNLAPVCDISANQDDFIYDRSFGDDAETVSTYISQVVMTMCEEGIGSVLKHFPGYGNCADTHEGIVVDHRAAEDFTSSDFLPFQAGVESGARAVMVCHNIVEAFDAELPASLSPVVHEILRETLGDNVVVLTDDLDMQGIQAYTDGASAAVQAVLAGNDLLLTSDYEGSIHAILAAIEEGRISAEQIDASVKRILTWKIDLGLIPV